MKKLNCILIVIFILIGINCFGQFNCEAVFEKDSPCYRACEILYSNIPGSRIGVQGARESQIKCDSVISLCPTFAEVYLIKAIPYLKRGEFWKWKPLIDKAVEYDTIGYIGYRGGARFMFLRDYLGAIADIELLKIKVDDIGSIYNGDYHLDCILAFCYRGIGDTLKAIEILQKHVLLDNRGFYDYYHLGVMLFQTQRLNEAEEALRQQIDIYPFADVFYYLALISKCLSNNQEFEKNIEKAHKYWQNGITLPGFNSYMDYPDKIYLKQIENLIYD
jgi:tetratricopeptide (TPR) repeat protein